MGGSLWNWYKYKITAAITEHRVAGHKAFAFFDEQSQSWRIHHLETGGHLANKPTLKQALAKARYDIKRTPDFQEQSDNMNPLENLPECDEQESLRRLALTENNERRRKTEEELSTKGPLRTLEI
jgi:hypothetical protein